MSDKRFKYGICIWNLPVEGPAACIQAVEYGLQGVELDMGNWEEGLPLRNPELQQAYLTVSREVGIEFPTLGANTLCTYGMSKAEKKDTVRDIFSAMVETAAAMGIPKLQVPSFIDGFITNEDGFRLL